jgi:uncharacterized protein YjiK
MNKAMKIERGKAIDQQQTKRSHMKKLSLACLYSLVLILASTLSGHAADLDVDYPIQYSNANYYAGTPRSLGSGVTYWRTRDTYLLLDNTVATYGTLTGARLVEYSRSNTVVREIVMVGFLDPEDIHWLFGDTFVISQEFNNNGSVNELVVISLPTNGTSMNISTASRRLTFPTSSFTNVHNKGIEAVAILGSTFYFTTEWDPLTPTNSWKVWSVPFLTNGLVTPTPAFDLTNLLSGRANDISGMATDGRDLWLLSHQGTGTEGSPVASVLKVATNGTLIDEYLLPDFGTDIWRQAEGIELFYDPVDLRLRILLAGEVGSGGTGVDFMLLAAPGLKFATVSASDGWRFYPFQGGGGSQSGYHSTTSAITTSVPDPAPQAVYQRLQTDYTTLTVNGLSPTTAYRVRVHLSSIQFTGWQDVLQDVWVSNGGSPNWAGAVNPYASGFNQATIVDLGLIYPSYPGYSGQLFIGITPSAPGKIVIVNGVEIWPDP